MKKLWDKLHRTIKYSSFYLENDTPLLPTKSLVPQWYKEAPRWTTKTLDMSFSSGIKLCVPFLDSLTAGYVVTLPSDLYVTRLPDGIHLFTWKGSGNYVNKRKSVEAIGNFPIPTGFSSEQFTWSMPAALELPKGYSLLFTHPLNRHDLPFYTLSAIIDADFPLHSGDVPFFLKDDFEGVLEKGTPIAQIIPFKRENWQMEHDSTLVEKATINSYRTNSKISGWYKQTHWKKKSYE